jgi:hypothetical protein
MNVRDDPSAPQPETVEIIRQWIMSTDYPVSDWERQFAGAIEAMMRSAGWTPPRADQSPIREAVEILRQVGSMEGRTDAQTYWFAKARDLVAAIRASEPASVGR